MRRPLCVALLVASGLVASSPAGAAPTASQACAPVRSPFPDSRYADVDLTGIRAAGVSCATARRVARGAQRKALGLTPPESGVLRFRWNGWRVTGDLRGNSDRYAARRGTQRVLWRF